uniref:Kazal-like domain-containing protein n=1 Tax=Laticauda laticaudata TaxID=8630 RepID=A0A8C5SKQ8_LATLA
DKVVWVFILLYRQSDSFFWCSGLLQYICAHLNDYITVICTHEHDPICATNGVTYANICLFCKAWRLVYLHLIEFG